MTTNENGDHDCDMVADDSRPSPWTPASPASLCRCCGEEPACVGLDDRCPRCERLSRQLA